MNPQIFIPQFVFWLNAVILLINSGNIIALLWKFHNKMVEEKIFVLLLLFNAFSLISVNIPASIAHYITYFEPGNSMNEKVAWLRFWDRYSMFLKSIINALMTNSYCIKWMRKFYK